MKRKKRKKEVDSPSPQVTPILSDPFWDSLPLEPPDAQAIQYNEELERHLNSSAIEGPGCKKRSQPRTLISASTVLALMDKRLGRVPDTEAMAVAKQALTEAARQKVAWLKRNASRTWLENIKTAAFEGDAEFFRDLANSFLALRQHGYSVDANGRWTKKHTVSKGKRFVFANFEKWDADGVKLESRAAEAKQRFKMARNDFFKALREARENKSPL